MTAAPHKAARELLRGEVIPGTSLHVKGVLGRGGFGTVYDCVNAKLECDSAVKLLNAELFGRSDLEQGMLVEARRMAKIESDHMVKVRSVGLTREARPRLYVEMFKLQGQSLYAVLRALGRLSVLESVLYSIHVCTGLASAHALGIVHCDIKPGNIFLTRLYDPLTRGWVTRAVVLDLGIARFASTLRSEGGDFAGTPGLAAPEQFEGRFYPQSDVYAVGITLFMMLTGKHPHAPYIKNHRELMAAKLDVARIKRLGNVLPEVAPDSYLCPELDDLVFRMMLPDFRDRPASMEHVLSELSIVQQKVEAWDLRKALLAQGKVKPKGRGAATTPETPEVMALRVREHYESRNEAFAENEDLSIDRLLDSAVEERKARTQRGGTVPGLGAVTPAQMRTAAEVLATAADEEERREQEYRNAIDDLPFRGPAIALGEATPGPEAWAKLEAGRLGLATPPPLAGTQGAPEGEGSMGPSVIAETDADREFFLGKSTQKSAAGVPVSAIEPAVGMEERVQIASLPRPDRGYANPRRTSTFAGSVSTPSEPLRRVPLQTRLRALWNDSMDVRVYTKASVPFVVALPLLVLAWRLGWMERLLAGRRAPVEASAVVSPLVVSSASPVPSALIPLPESPASAASHAPPVPAPSSAHGAAAVASASSHSTPLHVSPGPHAASESKAAPHASAKPVPHAPQGAKAVDPTKPSEPAPASDITHKLD